MKVFFFDKFLFVLLLLPIFSFGQKPVSLAGKWELRLDPEDKGLREHWWNQAFDDQVKLPGSLTENGKGYDITLQTPWTGDIFDSTYFISDKYKKYREGNVKIPFWLKPVKYYSGAAWYRKSVNVPADWLKERVMLNLERCHWEVYVFVNGQFCGMQNSLVGPQQFDISGRLKEGENSISLKIDNRVKLYIGQNSHSISDHTQSNWNGVVGDISLFSTLATYLDEVKIYPRLANSLIDVEVALGQLARKDFKGKVLLRARKTKDQQWLPSQTIDVQLPVDKNTFSAHYAIPNPALWDEFHPELYQLEIKLADEKGTILSEKTEDFGMRNIGTSGTRITINGKPVFLRGDIDCAAFPLTGYPPTDAPYWEKIFSTIKNYGLNHMRFHSWCPPEIAFKVADKLGVYLYVESPSWANQGSGVGNSDVVDDFIYQESERILKLYGNHPSFCMMSYGNEPGGANHKEFLGKWVNHFKNKDSRRLFTSASGWPALPENQFHVDSEARIQLWKAGLTSIINKEAPTTSYDWREKIRFSKVPYISHEIGQWCAYPNFKEMVKYKGVLKPANFEIFKETLEENGMGDQAADFLYASGRLQTLCYKADIEAALRTPGFGGFQLLGLHDFPGQGSALVGALDVFYDSKGYTTPEEYRTFCNATVPLARMKKLLFKNTETLEAELEIAHFGPEELKDQWIDWQITDGKGKLKQQGSLKKDLIKRDNTQAVGTVKISLSSFKEAQKSVLKVKLRGTAFENNWDFWVYPDEINPENARGKVIITHKMTDEITKQLQEGATVLLLPFGQVKKGKGAEVEIGFSSIFWNTAWTNGQAPHTLGITVKPTHPLFKYFPTESYSNFQWQELVSSSQTMLVNDLDPKIRPLIQPIDTWFENRKLSLAFEGKVSKGKLMVCSIDLDNSLNNRLSARQLKYSMLKYMNSKDFAPENNIDVKTLNTFFSGTDL